MLVVTKEKSYGRMNVSAEKYTCSFLQNVIKLKCVLSAIMMGHCNRWCMYHKVYQQLVVIFVPKPPHVLLPLTIQQMQVKSQTGFYFVLVNSKEQAERKHRHVDILGKEKVVTTRSCRRKSLQLLVSEIFSSGTNSTQQP